MANQEDHIERKYEKAFSQIGGIQTIFPSDAKIEMAKMAEQIAKSDKNISKIIQTNQKIGDKAGLVAEEWHAETFNLDAIYKEKPQRAITDRYKEWNKMGFKPNHGSSDIKVIDEARVVHSSQSKYYKTSKETADQMALLDKNTKKYKYAKEDSLIGPSDQVNPNDGSKSIKQYAHEKALKEEAKGTRPEVAEAHRTVEQRATDRLEYGGVSSKSLTKKGAEKIAENKETGKQLRKDVHNEYQTESTLKHMGKAATGAAAMSAITSGVYNTFTYLEMAKEGKITEDEAIVKIIGETVSSSADSAIKAAANTGVQSMLVRYSSKEAVKQVAKQGLKNMVKTNAISIAVVCGIDMVKDLVRLATGKITKDQFEERNGKNILNTSAGTVGSAIGGAVGSPFFPPIGTYIGGMAGGLIAGMAMTFAIENGIEKPYRELVENTVALRESMQVLQEVSYNIFNGQVVFTAFLEKERALNIEFENQMERVAPAGEKMSREIDRL